MSAGADPAPVTPVTPSLSRRATLPSKPTAKPEIDPLPVFAVYANRPSGVTATQHADVCLVRTDALIVRTLPSSSTSYEERALCPAAAPNASETITRSRRPNANPNGVVPDEAWT